MIFPPTNSYISYIFYVLTLHCRYVRMGERPDVALYTLFLRALLQQNKWQEGMLLFRRMLIGKEIVGRPNHHTLNCLLQYQLRKKLMIK